MPNALLGNNLEIRPFNVFDVMDSRLISLRDHHLVCAQIRELTLVFTCILIYEFFVYPIRIQNDRIYGRIERTAFMIQNLSLVFRGIHFSNIYFTLLFVSLDQQNSHKISTKPIK